MAQRRCIKFFEKMKLNVQGYLKCRLGSLLWVEHKFNCGIIGIKEGREDVNDDARPGRSITDENIEAVKKKILKNRGITIREFADDVGISFGSR